MIKIIFSDMDGTLLDDEGRLSRLLHARSEPGALPIRRNGGHQRLRRKPARGRRPEAGPAVKDTCAIGSRRVAPRA